MDSERPRVIRIEVGRGAEFPSGKSLLLTLVRESGAIERQNVVPKNWNEALDECIRVLESAKI